MQKALRSVRHPCARLIVPWRGWGNKSQELGIRPLQPHCHRGLGTLYATIGQQEQARAELDTAMALYRAMDMTFWLPQAEAALAQVEGR